MYRVGLVCVLSAAVLLGAVHCNSIEPEREPAQGPASLRTSVEEVTAPRCPSSCLGIQLGDYNVFLLEDFTYTGNIQGKLAVGGNITLSGFSVGTGLPDTHVSNTLVAGGNLTLTNGAVAGAAWYQGSYSPTGVGFSRGTATQGIPPDFMDFADRFSQLESLSTRLATQPLNGTTQHNSWSVTMTGTDPCLNVFTLNASDFTGQGDWTISAPADSFVLVNVFGQAPTYRGGNIQLAGISSQRVLFNFVEATTLTAESFKFQGTLLAPRARATIRYAGFTGGLYARALTLQFAPANLSPLDELAGAQAEVCNAVDDNCDGQVDEGFECSGSGGRSCTAWCGAEGTQSCNPATCGYGECTSASCCQADADCASGSYCEGSLCAPQLGSGASCTSSNQCATGQCVDGVCCNTACEGACDACNLAGQLGTCSPVPSTVQCRGAGGACDVAEYCTGSSAECPADAKKPATTECRGSAGVCDVAERCTGTSNDCPADGYASSTTLCRDLGGECDVVELCTGSSSACPADGKMPAGATCNDSNAGTTGDRCDGAGVCTGCGDGVRNGPEVCDDGNIVSETSCPYGQTNCTRCNATCTAVLHPPAGGSCGDGVRNGPEVCDDGNTVTETSCPYDTGSCTACNASCTRALNLPAAYCGDGVRNGPEVCDDGNTVSETSCLSNGASCTFCDAACASSETLKCSSSNATENKFINWYKVDLHRCADLGGLAFWVPLYETGYYNGFPQCLEVRGAGGVIYYAPDNFSDATYPSKDACFRAAFREAGRLSGEYP